MNPENLIGIFIIYLGLMFTLEGYIDSRWPDQKIEKLRNNVWWPWWPFPSLKTLYDPKYPLVIRGFGLIRLVFGLFWVIFGLLVAFDVIKLMSS